MLFWIVAALLTLVASMSVLVPLARRTPAAAPGSYDLEVYRDQLAELDRDAARALIGPAEAQEARTEIGRRILKTAAAGKIAAPMRFGGLARVAATVAVLAVPVLSWSLYARLGSPDLPSQPLSQRLAKDPADQTMEELLARAERHLAQNPSDGRGWDVVAPIYARIGRFADAVAAYRKAIDLLGDSADREAAIGEALTQAAEGSVSEEARAAFGKALALDRTAPSARFYLALAEAQAGRLDAASAAWQGMLAELPAASGWRQPVQAALAEVARRTAPGGADRAPGPTQQDMEAAKDLSQADRSAMVESMVARLDEKLRANPRDPEGWMRLVRSYMVLGRTDAAREALARGLDALGRGSADAARLLDFAANAGLPATE